MDRRNFLKGMGVGVAMSMLPKAASKLASDDEVEMADQEIKGAIVLCNHWTECAIGGAFSKGEINNRWYNSCFSTIFNIEQSRRWLQTSEQNRFCHDLDMFFLVALEQEDPQYLKTVLEMLYSQKMELVGGTFGQAESQVFGYESALRQLSLGQATAKKYTGKNVATYLVEEQSFFSQLPQILKLCGFKYASLQFQNSGTPDGPVADLIDWCGPDGSKILTVPNHPGLIGCYRQWSNEFYAEAMQKMKHFKSPLIFQWLELWVPGMDWGASVDPYRQAITWAEEQGYKQMTLTAYIEWAKSRSAPVETVLTMDRSNYDNNFFQGGWGYENERQARECNQCESLLLSAESLSTLIDQKILKTELAEAIADGWPRLLISQNHDAYLAGSILQYIDGLRSCQSELTFKQCSIIRNNLQKKIGFQSTVKPGRIRLFNPCPWTVTTPVMLEIDELTDHGQRYRFSILKSAPIVTEPVFRSDSGKLLASPQILTLSALGTTEIEIEETSEPVSANTDGKLTTLDNGQSWLVQSKYFRNVTLGPLAGKWKQTGMFFYDHPNTNIEKEFNSIVEAPVIIKKRLTNDSLDTIVWKKDLMRIRGVPEPALSLTGMVVAGNAGLDFAEFQYRLESVIRLQVGQRPEETWQFQLRLPDSPQAVFADSPFGEERRQAERFYCSRYVRFELADRHVLWCPSQNSMFRNLCGREKGLFDCKVLDFAFNGITNWGFRFYAASKISPAESIRFAESFHRSFVTLPDDCPELNKIAYAADNPDIVLFHVLPAAAGKSVLLRTLNAAEEERETLIKCHHRPTSVRLVDLQSELLDDGESRLKMQSAGWSYRFRKREIVTFEIKF